MKENIRAKRPNITSVQRQEIIRQLTDAFKNTGKVKMEVRKSIAEHYGISVASVTYYVKYCNFTYQHHWTEAELRDLDENYNLLGSRLLGERYGVSAEAIQRQVQNYRKRKI